VKFDVEKQFSSPQKCKSTSHVGTGHCVTCIERAIECGGSNRANLVSEESSVVIGVGAGKFWGVRRIFARIFPNLPEKNPKKVLHTVLGAIFFKSKHAGRHFCSYFQGVCSDFQGFCEGFQRFFPDFHQIKTFGGALALPPPTPVSVVAYPLHLQNKRSFRCAFTRDRINEFIMGPAKRTFPSFAEEV